VNTLNLLLGFLLDFFLGDPGGKWHPVVGIGKLIAGLEKILFPRERHFRREFVLGFVVVGMMVGGLGVGFFFLRRFLYSYSLLLFSAVEVYLIFNFLSLRTLLRRGREVKTALDEGDLPQARKNLKSLVGRDTDHLSEWEDVLNFLPARLSVIFIALAASILGRWGKNALFVALRDARKHQSPNAGWPESAMAGALGVRLGGVNYYGGKREESPFLGDFILDLTPERIGEALSIVRLSSFLALGFLVVVSILVGKVW
jgi:cobalamin biosynthesis protein CobD/CbiB